jgi:hypothetical protein
MCMILVHRSSFSVFRFPSWFAEEATQLLRCFVLEIGRVDPQFSSLEHLLPLLKESRAPVAADVSNGSLFSFLSTLTPSALSVTDIDTVQQYLHLRLTKDQNHRLEVCMCGVGQMDRVCASPWFSVVLHRRHIRIVKWLCYICIQLMCRKTVSGIFERVAWHALHTLPSNAAAEKSVALQQELAPSPTTSPSQDGMMLSLSLLQSMHTLGLLPSRTLLLSLLKQCCRLKQV